MGAAEQLRRLFHSSLTAMHRCLVCFGTVGAISGRTGRKFENVVSRRPGSVSHEPDSEPRLIG